VRALAWGLALSPLLPPLSLLAPLFLPWLRRLPRAALLLLLAYALSLLLPALPLGREALLLAALRLLYVLGLVGAGVALARTGVGPMPLGYGLFLLYISALLVSFSIHGELVREERLLHPFHSPVGLGFMGSLGVLLALHLRYPWPFRVMLGFMGVLVLLLTASRGGLLALALGGAASLIFHRRGWMALAAVGLVLSLAFFSGPPFRPGRALAEGLRGFPSPPLDGGWALPIWKRAKGRSPQGVLPFPLLGSAGNRVSRCP
jgi:O-antigen ligase